MSTDPNVTAIAQPMSLLRARLLKPRVCTVELEGYESETGDALAYVRALTGAQLEDLMSAGEGLELEGVRALSRVVCYCACDAQGVRVFSDDELESVGGMGMGWLKRLADAALDLSGLGDEEPEKKD